MPTICEFYGIAIMMYLKDKEHNPPHVHAFYGDAAASFLISTGELYEGTFPRRGRKMVRDFILLYRKELEQMWETGSYMKLKGLE